MLVVLLAKNGHTGLHTGKQFHHHGADTDKKSRPEVTLQHVSQLSRRVHLESLRLGVQLCLGGCKHHIAASSLQGGAIGVPGARVSVKVLVWQKLQAIDKNAHHQHVAQRFGLAHQRQMSGV